MPCFLFQQHVGRGYRPSVAPGPSLSLWLFCVAKECFCPIVNYESDIQEAVCVNVVSSQLYIEVVAVRRMGSTCVCVSD